MTDSKTTAPKLFCFVLMPFADEFDDLYQIGIKEACNNAGTYCERVDEQIFEERILDHIYNQIAKADMVIADMTGRNPNVFYEVGYAHALGKLTILLTENAEDIPFDLKHFPHIVYGKKISVLRRDLERKIRYFKENPPSQASDIKMGLELFLNGQTLTESPAQFSLSSSNWFDANIVVFNSSNQVYLAEDFKIGIVAERFVNSSEGFSEFVTLPNGGSLRTLIYSSTLFPDSFASFHVSLVAPDDLALRPGEKETISIMLFTKHGSRKFPVFLNF